MGRRKPVVFLYLIAIRSEKSQFIFWISTLLQTLHIAENQPAITKAGTLGAAREMPCRKLVFIWGSGSAPLMAAHGTGDTKASCCVGKVKLWKSDCLSYFGGC